MVVDIVGYAGITGNANHLVPHLHLNIKKELCQSADN